MVNTRRRHRESNGSTGDVSTSHRTRSIKQETNTTSSSANESDSEESNAESANPKTVALRPSRVQQIRTSFDERSLRRGPQRIAHSLAVYSNRKMHDDSDVFNDGNYSDEDLYERRGMAARRNRTHMTRIQRRTALSLRPISQKCYTDPHSPLHFNSDSDREVGVRRSKRNSGGKSTSWLRDDQMHKIGYPSLNAEYSEEDSREADVKQHRENIELTRRVTKCSEAGKRRKIKNPKYLFDYQTTNERSRRRRSDGMHKRPEKEQILVDKENNLEETSRSNGRLRPRVENILKKDDDETKESEDQSEEKIVENGDEDAVVNGDQEEDAEEKNKNEESSESDDDVPRRQTRTKSKNSPMMTRRNNKQIIGDSSSSESSRPKKYSLRNRAPPKPLQKTSRVEHEIRNRRRFQRRRNDSTSSSDSSSSQDVRRNNKPKSPHSKNERMKSGGGGSGKILPIRPETLDTKVRFNSIGGLSGHIQCLKEMIILPMMYPEVFRQFQVQPPRGVLFHGPPGTGKTLIARALANECSFGSKKVSFFMRKGADLLSKWIGESEKQLTLLFQQASEMKPSIIFFDELDGLAPVRSSRQDQVHASIVSTLLALMDGLDNRGEVIVIGATNRIDSIDPALRRPGRFDRELFFPLPSRKEREEILSVHVAQWNKPPSQELISYLAETSVGYCGSDLRALCSEAVIMSFRRAYPQVYSSEHRLLLDPENVTVEKVDFMRAKSLLVPASHRITQGLGRKLLPILGPILQEPLSKVLNLLKTSFPHGLNLSLAKVKLSPNVRPGQLLITGDGPEHGQTLYLAPAILYQMEHIHAYLLDTATLFSETGRSAEEAVIQVFHEAKRNVPSIIYIPSINRWWDLVSEVVQSILLAQLSQIDPNTPILFLATSDTNFNLLPEEIQEIFSFYRKEVYELEKPDDACRKAFFQPLIVEGSLKAPRSPRKKCTSPPPLPRAPTPPPTPITEEQAKKLYEVEEHTLRELRIFLRDMCKKLANNKMFYMFTKPVDTDEVPDYTTIITQPMDLETMMTKVDFHRYECAKDFLTDIELICHNALEYNPARTSADKQIRHRACSLRDYAYTLIKNEMDSDFEDKCQDISKRRLERKACTSKYLPAYINTPQDVKLIKEDLNQPPVLEPEGDLPLVAPVANISAEVKPLDKSVRINPAAVKKRRPNWKKGQLTHRKRKRAKLSLNTSQEDLNETKSSLNDSSQNLDILENGEDGSSKDSPEDNSGETPANCTEPLSVNVDCNTLPPTKPDSAEPPLLSPKRRLSDLMSPSELLDNPLDFDDVDEALNESGGQTVTTVKVEICQEELNTLLNKIVKLTETYSLKMLLDLYNQLNRIVKKYARTHVRNTLIQELSDEVLRFQKEQSGELEVFEEPSAMPIDQS